MRQNYFRHILLCLCLLAGTTNALAYYAKIDGIYYNFSGDKATVTYQEYQNYGYISDYSGSVVIPESVTYNNKTYNVTSIGDNAFSSCSGLTSVTIPNSVTSIGEDAFYGCSGLTSVIIPNSVTSIGEAAFRSCSGLTSVTIGNGVTSIGKYAFDKCSGLTSVHITDLAAWCNMDIQSNPLSYAHHLYLNGEEVKDLVIPEGINSCGQNFQSFIGLESVTIPNSVTSIDNGAFYGCSSLTTVTIGNSVTSIGESAFRDCSSLESVNIGNSVTSIGNYAFYGCSGLKSVTIPNSVTSIGALAFCNCRGLTSVTIPNSVTSIGGYAFNGCSGLTSVTIPESVTSIGRGELSGSFTECSKLTTVIIESNAIMLEYQKHDYYDYFKEFK